RGGGAVPRRKRSRNPKDQQSQGQHNDAETPEQSAPGTQPAEKAEQTRNAIASIAAATSGHEEQSSDKQSKKEDDSNNSKESNGNSSRQRQRNNRRRNRRGSSSAGQQDAQQQQSTAQYCDQSDQQPTQ